MTTQAEIDAGVAALDGVVEAVAGLSPRGAWLEEIAELYMRSPSMEVWEYEHLLDLALNGGPDERRTLRERIRAERARWLGYSTELRGELR